MNYTISKVCARCNIAKDAKQFYRLSRGKNGLSLFCRDCCTEEDVILKCDTCGKVRVVKSYKSVWANTCKSCGSKAAAWTNYYDKRYSNEAYKKNRLIGAIYRGHRKSAKKRGIEFSITKEDLGKLIDQDCYYCGGKPNNKFKIFYKSAIYVTDMPYQGLDRIDSQRGYTVDNIRPCCIVCNHLKWDHTEAEFLNSVKIIYERLIGKTTV